jgi:thiol-disulfide isomerase/thioredoxin
MTGHLPVHAVVFVIAILSATLHAQDASPLSLENILELHSQHLDHLKTGDITYVVTRPSQPGDPLSTETYRVTINGSFEASRLDGQAKPEQCWWDGAAFGRTIGLDLSGPKLGVDSILKASGTIYRYDLPVRRLFSWRSLRSYRLFASDHDLSLRVLCEQSPDKAHLLQENGLIRLSLGHPGCEASETPAIPPGTPILIDIDPAHGYMMCRCETTLTGMDGQGDLTQTFEVLDIAEFPGELFLPTRVHYSARSNGVSMEQQIDFRYTRVNEGIETQTLKFAPNLLVEEFEAYGDVRPSGFYVVGSDGSLGERYNDETVALAVRNHRLGVGPTAATSLSSPVRFIAVAGIICAVLTIWILVRRRASVARGYFLIPPGIVAAVVLLVLFNYSRTDSLDATIDRLKAAPKPGARAQAFTAFNLTTGATEEIAFPGEVTVLEFWATWCGPCQLPMQHLDELVRKNRDKWTDRVRVVTISVDEDSQVARRHVEKKQWASTRTLSDVYNTDSKQPGYGFPSAIARSYGIAGVPTCLLIDRHGDIVFRGHPRDVDLEAEIGRLISEGPGK